ncbi:MAG: hypothetical protein COA79_09960 [Planctomycetota bacterium]|nr:MAG: hypothetical protein COA79_09960 [Planctomycetota bacterium]
MDTDKFEQWKKYHEKGYGSFMKIHLAFVLGFFSFTGTIAYVQMSMTMPPSIKESGGSVPLWPIAVVVFVMVPLSIVYSHFLWKNKEKQFQEHQKGN